MIDSLFSLECVYDDPRFERFYIENEDIQELLNPETYLSCGLQIPRLGPDWKPSSPVGRVKAFNDYPALAFPFHAPIFSQRTMAVVEDLISDCGEVLPLKCKIGEYVLFHVTSVLDVLDLEKSDINFGYEDSNKISKIKHAVLKDDALLSDHIFRIPQFSDKVFVSG